MTTTLYLKGLSCPNCAAKIERELRKLDWVKSAQIALMKEELSIEHHANAPENIHEIVEKLVKSFEPDVDVLMNNVKTKEHTHDHDASSKRPIQFVVGGVIAGIAILLSYLFPEMPYIGVFVFVLSYMILGYDVVFKALRTLLSRELFDENLLMTIATVGAFCIGEYPEAIAVMLLYQIGEWFQDKAVAKSKRSIASMMDICPETARVLRDGAFVEVPAEEAVIGDTILVQPGEKIPMDGVVMTGDSKLDTRALTGESVPRSIHAGETVLSGTVNLESSLQIEVTRESHDSTAAKVVRLVEDAAAQKAPSEEFITKFARYYTPAVVALAVLIAVVPLFVTGGAWQEWFRRACIFLVISCPCALVISIPLTYFSGIGVASKAGILVKGGNHLETLGNVQTVVFDKTGTLTKGSFEVTDIAPTQSRESLIQAAFYAEQNSNHPIAKSIVKYCGEMASSQPDAYTEIPGKGVSATFGTDTYHAGNAALMQSLEIAFVANETAGTVVHVARNQTYLGSLVIADAIRPEAESALTALRALDVSKTAILSGDAESVVADVAKKLAMDEYKSELLPADKINGFEAILHNGNGAKTAYVGDGINDSPVLARADVGISMGALGSDAAVEASDIVLMRDDLSLLPKGIQIARKTHRIVIQNITFALGIKSLFLILGAFGIANLWTAVFADVGVTLIAILNAMRMLKYHS